MNPNSGTHETARRYIAKYGKKQALREAEVKRMGAMDNGREVYWLNVKKAIEVSA